jgi:rhodanese-related sulfurtransferase
MTTLPRHPEIPSTTLDALPDPLPEDLTVLDVREPEEWAHGHIDGALHVPMMELPQRREELPEGQVLVVCRIGARSRQVTHWLAQFGVDAVNLDGGMIEWAAAGRPMLSDTGHEPHVV